MEGIRAVETVHAVAAENTVLDFYTLLSLRSLRVLYLEYPDLVHQVVCEGVRLLHVLSLVTGEGVRGGDGEGGGLRLELLLHVEVEVGDLISLLDLVVDLIHDLRELLG